MAVLQKLLALYGKHRTAVAIGLIEAGHLPRECDVATDLPPRLDMRASHPLRDLVRFRECAPHVIRGREDFDGFYDSEFECHIKLKMFILADLLQLADERRALSPPAHKRVDLCRGVFGMGALNLLLPITRAFALYSRIVTGLCLPATLGTGKNRPTANRPGPAIKMGSSVPIARR